MVLYEDLRIYTIWRTDMARASKASNDPNASPTTSTAIYSKSAEEWEILGELAERLHHLPEAIEAYQSCLRIRFSPKAMRAVVRMWEEERKTENVLQGMIRLIAWQYRWYSEVSGWEGAALSFCVLVVVRYRLIPAVTFSSRPSS